ncbi:MAG: MEMO1 family protein [Candidatus Hydrogenedentota bacterium]
MPLPPLRYLDISPVEHNGETMICFRDQEGYVEDPIVLSPLAFFIAAKLDGEREVEDIQSAFFEESGGRTLESKEILSVVSFLEEHGFLYSQTFLNLRDRVIQEYQESEVRPAYLAGRSYPSDSTTLRQIIDSFFTCGEGPGRLAAVTSSSADRVRCVIVPHIDFDRGGPVYAHGYLPLFEGPKPDAVVVFGVAHAGASTPFVLTRKDFETPFGVVPADRMFIEEIAGKCGFDPFEDEIVHRTEHSVEFQAVMLAYHYGTSVPIVPILCGPFGSEDEPIHPEFRDSIAAFLDKCATYAGNEGKYIVVLAGADLAHVGHRFGDEFDVDDEILAQVLRRDEEDLFAAQTGDAETWYASVLKDGNARRVCGLNCVFSALKSAGRLRPGTLHRHSHAPDPAGGIVSFAGMTFR